MALATWSGHEPPSAPCVKSFSVNTTTAPGARIGTDVSRICPACGSAVLCQPDKPSLPLQHADARPPHHPRVERTPSATLGVAFMSHMYMCTDSPRSSSRGTASSACRERRPMAAGEYTSQHPPITGVTHLHGHVHDVARHAWRQRSRVNRVHAFTPAQAHGSRLALCAQLRRHHCGSTWQTPPTTTLQDSRQRRLRSMTAAR